MRHLQILVQQWVAEKHVKVKNQLRQCVWVITKSQQGGYQLAQRGLSAGVSCTPWSCVEWPFSPYTAVISGAAGEQFIQLDFRQNSPLLSQEKEFSNVAWHLTIFEVRAAHHDCRHTQYIYTRLGRKGVNFGNSLMAAGVCYMGSRDEDVDKYFGKKHCVYLCPIWSEIYLLSHCSKFAMKINFSPGGCQTKLVENHSPKCWCAPVCQKNILQQVLKKKITTYFSVLCNFKCIWA